jgi:hypothetical protein
MERIHGERVARSDISEKIEKSLPRYNNLFLAVLEVFFAYFRETRKLFFSFWKLVWNYGNGKC